MGRLLNKRAADRQKMLDICWKNSICEIKMNSKCNHMEKIAITVSGGELNTSQLLKWHRCESFYI